MTKPSVCHHGEIRVENLQRDVPLVQIRAEAASLALT